MAGGGVEGAVKPPVLASSVKRKRSPFEGAKPKETLRPLEPHLKAIVNIASWPSAVVQADNVEVRINDSAYSFCPYPGAKGSYGKVLFAKDGQRVAKVFNRSSFENPAMLREAYVLTQMTYQGRPINAGAFGYKPLSERGQLQEERPALLLRHVGEARLEKYAVTPAQVLMLLLQVLGLHLRGMTHNDIKPGNICWDHEGFPTIVDYGTVFFGNGWGTSGSCTTFRYAHCSVLPGQYDPKESPYQKVLNDLHSLGVTLAEYELGVGYTAWNLLDLPCTQPDPDIILREPPVETEEREQWDLLKERYLEINRFRKQKIGEATHEKPALHNLLIGLLDEQESSSDAVLFGNIAQALLSWLQSHPDLVGALSVREQEFLIKTTLPLVAQFLKQAAGEFKSDEGSAVTQTRLVELLLSVDAEFQRHHNAVQKEWLPSTALAFQQHVAELESIAQEWAR